MSPCTIEISPKVREIIEQALAASRVFWVGLCAQGAEIVPRQPTRLEAGFVSNEWFNADKIQWTMVARYDVEICVIAETKTAAPFSHGPVLFNGETPVKLWPADQLLIHIGQLRLVQALPQP